MQFARPALPHLNIELAHRKQHKQQDVEIDPNPPSPLSPPTFVAKSSVPCPPSEILLLDERYLLLECVELAVSPQSQPLRKCVDTVTEEVYYCRECPRSPSTSSLLEAHHRLRDSEAVTPIARLVETRADGQSRIFVLYPTSYGDLHSYLRAKRRLKESEARALFRQAAQAVSDCHRKGVVLTDLKLRRFVFSDPQRTQLRLESLEEAVVLERSDSDDRVWRKHGYPAYVTPEVLLSRGARYSGRAADLWSLGIILYTLLVGRYPFQDSGPFGLFTKIIRGNFTIPEFVSSRARCLIRNLLRKDPNQRLEAGDILLHPWFTAVLRTAKTDLVKSKPEVNSVFRPEPILVDQIVPEVLVDSRMEDC